ncbi:MAG: magnesium-protoporphyrin IX monomethyl ester (oxidative) cyclase, partial [Pseudomonadota bacterium]
SEISRQVFPLTLDIDHPRWIKSLRALQRANADLAEAKQNRKIFKRLGATVRASAAFVSLLTIPAIKNEVPVKTRLEPAY